jgi:predicted nuclease of predicted toxin-antitoxin system
MRFKVDENLPVEIAELLCTADHDATTVHDQALSGSSASSIADACRREGRMVGFFLYMYGHKNT